MTEQRRREIRAELARRMGWTCVAGDVGFCPEVSRQLAYCPNAFKEYICGQMKRPIPDPFTNAADNRALVKWLAADDARWKQFDDRLLMDLSLQPLPAYDNSNPGFQRMMRRQILTAPRETITLAAARALGIETE